MYLYHAGDRSIKEEQKMKKGKATTEQYIIK